MARGLDHLVLAMHDLDRGAELFRRLGFTVGARNRHPWGTLNHILQLDGTFLELIATEPGFVRPERTAPVMPFAGFLDTFLSRREGFAMLVLESPDARSDADAFARAGIGVGEPFYFARTGRRPDGSEVQVAFTLAFAATQDIAEAGFFVCQQHVPEAFWNRELQRHANAAVRVEAVALVAEAPTRLEPFLSAFVGATATPVAGGLRIDTGRGRIEVSTESATREVWGADSLAQAAPSGPWLAGVRLGVRDLAATRAVIEAAALPCVARGRRLIVPADAAFGTALAFEAA